MIAYFFHALLFFIVGVFFKTLLGLLFININPYAWKSAFTTKGKRGEFIFLQVVRVIMGAIVLFVVYDLILVEKTIGAFITHVLWIICIFHICSALFNAWDNEDKAAESTYLWQLGISIIVLIAIPAYAWIQPVTVYTQLGKIPVVSVTDEPIEELDPETLPLVLPENAIYKADKKGSSLDKPSYYEEGEVRLSNIGGELVHSIAIEFSSGIKAMKQKTSPGYYTISATDVSADSIAEVHYADMNFSKSNVFGADLERHLRKTYPNDIFYDIVLEQDDEGNPYYVTSYGHYANFRTGSVVDGVIITNPEDGKSEKFKVGKEPAWIDQVYPESIADTYFDYWGVKRFGFNGKKNGDARKHGDIVAMFNEEKQVVYVTYFSRINASKGGMAALGVFNAKTGNMTVYESVDGMVTGDEALAVVSQTEFMNTKKTWVPKMATLHMIYGVASYTVPIYDADSRYVGLSIVKANGDNRMVAFGSTKEEAFDQYKMLIANQGTGDDVSADTEKEIKQIKGTVQRIAQKNENLWLVLLQEDSHFFAVESQDELILTTIGDQVTLDYYVIEDQTLPVTTFKNESLN